MSLSQTVRPAQSPEKLDKLKSGYTAAVDRAVSPLKKTYLAELQKLKTEYTKSGNLEAALAVDAEIQNLGALSIQSPSNLPSSTPRVKLENTTWLCKALGPNGGAIGALFEFLPDGRTQTTYPNGKVVNITTWGVNDQGETWIKQAVKDRNGNDWEPTPVKFTNRGKKMTYSFGEFELQKK